MSDVISDTAFRQVIVTTPDSQQVLVRFWENGRVEADWRAVAHSREVWRPVDPRDWYEEFQS